MSSKDLCAGRFRDVFAALALGGAGTLSACVGAPVAPASGLPPVASSTTARSIAATPVAGPATPDPVQLLDRLSWGANSADYARMRSLGPQRWLQEQLRPDATAELPAPVAEQIAAMAVSRHSMAELVAALEGQHKAADALPDEAARKAALHDYQLELNRLAREAATRQLLRDLYSPRQLQEQLTWFWLNHFNVHQHKHMIRAMVGDYEDRLRDHALGRFRDLLAASARHPAMLSYLDNAQNAVHHVNENYARELLELHTLGVDGGYTQRDVQELARVLTGFGVHRQVPAGSDTPQIRGERATQYTRDGLFEFNPNRHDYGDKTVLGHTIAGRGPAELDEVLDLLGRHPATARNVSRKLARFSSPTNRRRRSSRRWRVNSCAPMAISPPFCGWRSPRRHSPVAAQGFQGSRALRGIGRAAGLRHQAHRQCRLNRLGEGPYNHPTPEGYSLAESAWDGPGQMAVRFEIAKAIGSGSAGLFKTDGPNPSERPAFPQLANALYYGSTQAGLAPATRQALEQAQSPQEWNLLLLSSPEFMMR